MSGMTKLCIKWRIRINMLLISLQNYILEMALLMCSHNTFFMCSHNTFLCVPTNVFFLLLLFLFLFVDKKRGNINV